MMLIMRDSAAVSGHQVARYSLAVVSLATAVIHFAVSGEHFQEYWLFGVFMLVVAWGQLTGPSSQSPGRPGRCSGRC